MKLTRKLIPAMIMLLVSAVLMSTASFAWFSVNSKVTATGLKVTAVAPASLWIQQKASDTRVTTITLENENTASDSKQFTPVTPVDDTAAGGAWTFNALTGAAAQYVKDDGTIDTSKAAYEETSDYHYMDKFLLSLDGQTGQTTMINAQHTVTWKKGESKNETADLIYQAIHVALVSGDTVIMFDTAALETPSQAQDFITMTAAAEATEVYVYIWIEGNDEQCKNANAYNVNDFEVNIIFNLGNAKQN